MRETGIFTGTTSSLCLSLRQLPDRYAIRAGRNLPDKEFRYLRTVHLCSPESFDSDVIVGIASVNPSSRDEDRTISSSLGSDAWRVVSEDSISDARISECA